MKAKNYCFLQYFIFLCVIINFYNFFHVSYAEQNQVEEEDHGQILKSNKITNLSLQIPSLGVLKIKEGDKLPQQPLLSFDKIVLEKNDTETVVLETNGKWLIDVATGSFISSNSFDIALVLYNGGSGGYCDIVLLSPQNNKLEIIYKEEDVKGPIVKFEDLNKDGITELVIKYLEVEDVKTNRFFWVTKYLVYNNGKIEEKSLTP